MSLRALTPLAYTGAAPDAGRQARLEFVSLKLLRIDESYQRAVTRSGAENILRIMGGFSWSKFSPLILVPVGDGRHYFVVDGQHRAMAAFSLGYERAPAAIIDATAAEAADIFAAINGTVTAMSALALFKAARAAGTAWATNIDRACAAAGVTALSYPIPLSKQKPLCTQSIGAMRRILNRHGFVVLRAVLCAVAAPGEAKTPGYIGSAAIGRFLSSFLTRPGWVRQYREVAAAVAGISPAQMNTAEIERAILKRLGDGRTAPEDMGLLRRKIMDLKARKFSRQMAAASLRLPYAEVDRLWGEA